MLNLHQRLFLNYIQIPQFALYTQTTLLSMNNRSISATEDNSLLLKVAAGDFVAFGELVKQRWQKLLQHALTFVKSYQVA